MKNVSKILLFGVLAGAGYLLSVAYGADCPNVFGSYICSTTNVCNNPGGTCLCNGVAINDGQTCSDTVDPTADGVLGNVDNGNVCGDADGCNCGSTVIANGATCSIVVSDTTAPTLVGGSVSVVNTTATFPFTCDEGPVTISCLGSCGTCSVTANTGDNSVSFTLSNGTYSDCSLIGQDSAGNVSSTLIIPTFTINYTAPSGGGGGGTSICSDSNLVCTDGVYKIKSGGYYCVGGNLGKTCSSNDEGETLSSVLDDLDLTETGLQVLLDDIIETNSILYTYSPQDITIKIYVPKYKIYLIKKTILTLNNRLISSISKKLLKATNPSYMIENYENLTNDSVILLYKDIGALTKTYNDFLGVLYMVLDLGQRDYLPLAKYYLETYFTQYATFNN